MARSTKSDSSKSEAFQELPFEEALKKLEGVVESMENEELPLEKLLALYEEGIKLRKVCQDKLAEAEVKIQKLEASIEGDLRLNPLTLNNDSE